METETKAPRIYAAMAEIMAAIGSVAKGRRNKEQGYDYRGIDDVYNELHSAFADAGVFVTPRIVEHTEKEGAYKSGSKYIHRVIKAEFDFVAADGTKHTIGPVYGEGMDNADKAFNKAESAALKYALMMALLIPTAEPKDSEVPVPGSQGGRPSGLPTPAPTAPDAPAAKPEATAGQAAATGGLMPDGAIDPANLPQVALDYIAAHADTLRDAAGKITDKLVKAIKERPEAFKTAVTGWAKETGWKVKQ
jgi:hypothetical protein